MQPTMQSTTRSTEPAMTAATERAARSPGLDQFRKNPFRVLRLPSTATAKQAVWQCDKALARFRVGMALPDPDPLPWLAAADEIEIQEAAQTMESPLARLVEQLLWFDSADALGALAATDSARLRQILDSGAATIGDRIERANLRLVLGFSMLRGTGPVLADARAGRAIELAWRTERGLRIVDDPHTALAAEPAQRPAWAELIATALAAWGELLAMPLFVDHVTEKIAALGDELLGADDVEAVLSAIRTRLADLIVGETKLELTSGKLAHVAQLSALAGASGIDSEVWLAAFRPLRSQFAGELAELAPDAETGKGAIDDVDAYLDRLTTLARRWRPLDEAQLLGLGALIDDAAGAAFRRLVDAPSERQLEPRFKEVLHRLAGLAVSMSVKERITNYEARLADVQRAMCHFCGKRELDASSCASLSSQREISREQFGNQIHVQYQLGARPVARCPRCAQIHGFIRRSGHLIAAALAATVVIVTFIHPSTWFRGVTTGAAFVLFVLGLGFAFALGYAGRSIVAAKVVEKGARSYSDYFGSVAHEGLTADGFSSMKYDFRPNAWELVNTQGVKARHGGGGFNSEGAGKAIVYVALGILLIAIRMCGR